MRLPFAARKATGRADARARGAANAAPDEDLFDESFQKKLEYLALVARRVFAGRTRAERRSRRPGAGIEFADYREYFPGDDYRNVDWNVYGRSERLMLRQHEQEEDLAVYLLLDCSGSMAAGRPRKLDYAKRLSAALAYVALNHLDRVSLCALRTSIVERLPVARGRNRIFTIFDFLRLIRAEGRTDLGLACAEFVAQNKRRGIAIVLSDLYDPDGFAQAIRRLRHAGFETHVLHITDLGDREPGLHGDVELVDVETGAVRQTTVSPRLLARYREAYRAHLARLQAICVEARVSLSSVDTATPFEDAVLRLLRKGGLLD